MMIFSWRTFFIYILAHGIPVNNNMKIKKKNNDQDKFSILMENFF